MSFRVIECQPVTNQSQCLSDRSSLIPLRLRHHEVDKKRLALLANVPTFHFMERKRRREVFELVLGGGGALAITVIKTSTCSIG